MELTLELFDQKYPAESNLPKVGVLGGAARGVTWSAGTWLPLSLSFSLYPLSLSLSTHAAPTHPAFKQIFDENLGSMLMLAWSASYGGLGGRVWTLGENAPVVGAEVKLEGQGTCRIG